jgi:hypothetical protein
MVEVDSRMGLYSGCTPNPSTGAFECDSYASPYDCWYNATGPSQLRHNSFVEMFEGTAGCTRDAAGCRCKPWLEQSLGLYVCPECDRHASWHKQTPLWLELEKMAVKLNGSWYSTRSEGQCAGGQQVGVDCWWREVAVQTTINATCLADRLKGAIVDNLPSCFQGCAQPTNSTSDCWITCMLQSINGAGARGWAREGGLRAVAASAAVVYNRSSGGAAGGSPLSREAIVRAFTGAFSSEVHGGCPKLPPPGRV